MRFCLVDGSSFSLRVVRAATYRLTSDGEGRQPHTRLLHVAYAAPSAAAAAATAAADASAAATCNHSSINGAERQRQYLITLHVTLPSEVCRSPVSSLRIVIISTSIYGRHQTGRCTPKGAAVFNAGRRGEVVVSFDSPPWRANGQASVREKRATS